MQQTPLYLSPDSRIVDFGPYVLYHSLSLPKECNCFLQNLCRVSSRCDTPVFLGPLCTFSTKTVSWLTMISSAKSGDSCPGGHEWRNRWISPLSQLPSPHWLTQPEIVFSIYLGCLSFSSSFRSFLTFCVCFVRLFVSALTVWTSLTLKTTYPVTCPSPGMPVFSYGWI